MSCNRDESCKYIASDYGHKYNELKNDFKYIRKEIEDIDEELSKQLIPDDYLGRKVTEKLEKLKLDRKDNNDLFDETEKSITRFVEGKAIEHMNHYHEWFNQQKEEKKDKENDNNVVKD
jgi:hypothetical protein